MFPVNLAQLLGWACLTLTCVVVAWRGERPEKLGAGVIAAAWILSTLVEQRRSWLEPQFGVFAVDVLALAAFIALAFWSRRYWAIYVAGFHAIGVMTHLLFLINPAALYRAYYMINFSMGFLLLGALLAGTIFETSKPPAVSRR
jgi:hypothetical protein